MNKEEIKQLLEKYYDGSSTEEEEEVLKEFFFKEIVPDEFHHERAIFGYFRKAAKVPEPSADFEKRIISAVENEDVIIRPRSRRILLVVAGIAAGIALLAGTYFFLKRINKPSDTFSDPAIAYAETMKVLYSVSYQLNHGARSLGPVTRLRKVTIKSLGAFENPARILDEKLNGLNQLNRTVKTLDLINNENKINKN